MRSRLKLAQGDALFDGRRFRVLSVLITSRTSSWRSLWISPCVQRSSSERWIGWSLNMPDAINVDNRGQFFGKVMGRWVYENIVELDSSRCGTPTGNAMVESFNG